MTFRLSADWRIKTARVMGYHKTYIEGRNMLASKRRRPSERTVPRESERDFLEHGVRDPECRANLAHVRHGKLLSGLPETEVKMLVPCHSNLSS